MRNVLLFFLGCFLLSCGSDAGGKGGFLKVGVDPEWYPNNFGKQTPYVNGFVEDLLLEVALYTGIEFEKMTAGFDSLYDGIQRGKYDAVLSSLPPLNFNLAKYDFSQNFLDLGPVLVVLEKSNYKSLEELKAEAVGIIEGSPSEMILEKHPEIFIKRYELIADLLNALQKGEIEAALQERLPVLNYVEDLYEGQLKIVSSPLNNAGLHMVAAKDKQTAFIQKFSKALEHFQKNKRLEALQKKWNL